MRFLHVSTGLLLAAALLSDSQLLAANGNLSEQVSESVQKIVSAMNGSQKVSFKGFTDLSRASLSGQIKPLIDELFREELKRHEVSHSDEANLVLKGEFFVTDSDDLQKGQPLRLTIKPELTKRNGMDVQILLPIKGLSEAKHFAQIDSTRDLALAFGFNGAIPGEGSPKFEGKSEAEQKAIRQEEMAKLLLDRAPPFLHGQGNTLISSSKTSQIDLAIRAKSLKSTGDYVPREVKLVEGLANVPLEIDDVYELVVTNRTNRHVVVDASVDGLSVFYFSQSPGLRWVVPPKNYKNADGSVHDGTLTIVGWHKSVEGNDNHLRFLVTELGKGAVTKAGITSREKVGAIHVQYSFADPLPEGASPKSASHETGFGPSETVNQKVARYEIAVPHEFVTVRYSR